MNGWKVDIQGMDGLLCLCRGRGLGWILVNKGQIREVQIPIRVDAFNSQLMKATMKLDEMAEV